VLRTTSANADQVLDTFNVAPDYDLSIMQDKQTLFDITTNILSKIKVVLEDVKQDIVLVHGDTSTTFVTALACFFCKFLLAMSKLDCVHMISIPYHEEFNRQAVSIISQYNFAPPNFLNKIY
jgi:UDP-N-acetylglucosamine 2-epimerase (non-hydrolysing)